MLLAQLSRIAAPPTMAPTSTYSRGNSQNAYHRLPVELRLKIIRASADLSSLWSLIDASPTMAIVFNTYAVEIVDAFIATTVPSSIQCLMRAVLRVQASSVLSCHYHSWEESSNIILETSNQLDPAEINNPEPLRRFLSLAHKIHVLAHTCIDHYIQRSMAMRPSSLIRFGPYHGLFRGANKIQAFDTAESRPYQPRNTGPPSWVEEQRAIKALWRIQFFSELKLAQNEGRLDWSGEDLEMLESTSLASFYSSIQAFEQDQVATIWEFMQERGGVLSDSIPSISQQPTAFLREGFNVNCAPQPFPIYAEDRFNQGEVYLDNASMCWLFHKCYYSGHLKLSPTPGISFEPYRKFGFAIWDNKRITDLGFGMDNVGNVALIERTKDHYIIGLWNDDYTWDLAKIYYVWYSVLTEEEKFLSRSQ